MDDAPTIEETHRAKDVYLRGMAANYPGVDPRMSLLGMKDNGYTYETEGYGNSLVPTPSPRAEYLRSVWDAARTAALAVLVIQIIIRWL